MKLHQLVEEYDWPTIEGKTMTFYHCGNKFDGGFDLKFSGTGEGMRILGPGMYFIDNKDTARVYAKYAKTDQAQLYTCEVKIDNFYNTRLLPTDRMVESMNNIAKELGFDSYKSLPRNYDSLRNGRGFIGDVVKHVGHKAAQQLFLKHGINGAAEHINPAWEIAVFNMSCVRVVEREEVSAPK